jgi:hypothetical protein
MQDEGMLKTDNLVSAGLYDPKGLTDFLNRAQQPGFTRHQQLQVLVSVELICRMCGLTEVKEKAQFGFQGDDSAPSRESRSPWSGLLCRLVQWAILAR